MANYYRCSIGLDLDGTIRDFIGQLNYYYDKDYPNQTRQRVCDWDLSKYYSIGQKVFDYAYNQRGYEITTFAQPYKLALEFYKELVKLGDVWIITNQRNNGMRGGTLQWIDKYLYDYSGIIFTENKNLSFLDYLIDDYPKNLTNFDNTSLCVMRDWNESYEGNKHTYEDILDVIRHNNNS